jgi:hypothetical protein
MINLQSATCVLTVPALQQHLETFGLKTIRERIEFGEPALKSEDHSLVIWRMSISDR